MGTKQQELKEACKVRGLSTRGNKAELVARLNGDPPREARLQDPPMESEDYDQPTDEEGTGARVVVEYQENLGELDDLAESPEKEPLYEVHDNHLRNQEYPETSLHTKVLSFGKYRGRTYYEVMTTDPQYCMWAVQVIRTTATDASPPMMKDFVDEILADDPDLDWQVVLFGKYRDMPFEEVAQQDPEYCGWVMFSAKQEDCTSAALLAFADYLREHHPELDTYVEPPSDSCTFGKHKGEPFKDIVRDDPEYCKWVVTAAAAEDNRSTGMKKFAAWIKENAPELLEVAV